MKSKLVVITLLSVALAPGAHATTVNFEFLNNSTNVAEGSFSYADGLTGVLGYADLSAFSIHFDNTNNTYNLAFATNAANQELQLLCI